MFWKLSLITLLLGVVACSPLKDSSASTDTSTSLRLFYHEPAQNWMEEALPIGNAYMGAMFFGGTEEAHIQFNEESLWSGGKGEWSEYQGGNRPGAHKHLPQVRKLLAEGNYEAAHKLANKELTGVIKANHGNSIWEGFGAYQAFGDVFVKPIQEGTITNYTRELDINRALATVKYAAGEIEHTRQYFASFPKRALVFSFSNNSPEGLTYEIRQSSLHKNVTFSFENEQLIMKGKLENNGMEFESRMKVEAKGAEIVFENNVLRISSAKHIRLYLTAATSYLNQYPHYTGRDYQALNKKTIAALSELSYHAILAEHLTDYQSLFHRVSLELAEDDKENIPTNERLKAYKEGQADPALEALYFQYGRYLLISSSRPGSMPANLQGKWNDKTNPPWASDYHANINIQMIYWPAEVANLAECHEPLIEYIDKLRAPGRKTAQDFFHADGWIVNSMNNVFGFTAPGWDFPWGFFPGGAGWYAQHVWEHYAFEKDETYLRDKGYPIMKDAAKFWLDYLTLDEKGHLVSSPSYSPEHGGISTGAYMDIQIAWDLFSNCIHACEVLEMDEEFKQELIQAKNKLLPLKIGKWGQLQEWKEDLDDATNKHRHVSHLFALHPGKQISVLETPKLAEAAKVSLEARGDDGTGWSIAWKINFWARLLDGNRAYKLLKRGLQLTSESGYNMMDGGGIYPNLFSTHPPFQLDGNMGGTAGIAEMLLQSHTDKIHLLPALPDAWATGEVNGLRARGGFDIDMKWEEGRLITMTISSDKGGTCIVKYGKLEKKVELKAGEAMIWDGKSA